MYPAHIRETGERQTVQEHCRNTAALAATALRPLGLEKSAYLVGLLHDAGKNKQEYAQYLSEAVSGGNAVRGSVNHTFAGVRLLLDRWHGGCGTFSYSDVTAELLAFAVGSHHGLFDCIDPQQHSGFFHRQTKEGIFYDESRQGFLAQVAAEEELEHLFRDAIREMTPMLDRLAALSTQADDNEADRETAFYIGLLARMLLSAVIEGDRADTAAFMDGVEPPVFPEDMRPIWAERLAFMEKKLAAFPRKTPIDLARQTISDTCAAGAAGSGGVYRLNVPTGGGKTLASLRFALTHAAKRNCSRIIFTAPLLSILDQNAHVIRDYMGDDTLILEHHSNLAEPKEAPERLQELELLTASWSAPIIITTLVQLLMAFRLPTEGKIYFDGRDAATLSRRTIRHNISCVLQRAGIYSGTIRENIAMGRPGASEEELMEAAAVAQMADYIKAQPEGLDHRLEQAGKNLSGGQKQRVSIARAVLKNAPIYLFDDSFSALDFMTEANLRRALAEKAAGRTQIVVTQRVTSAMSSDQIFVMDGGRLVDSGTHRELLERCKVYREIYLSQTGGERR